jgi:hypothetical protein
VTFTEFYMLQPNKYKSKEEEETYREALAFERA